MKDVARMLRYHADGLQRVARVIEGNPDYDDLMAHKLTREEFMRFDAGVSLEGKRMAAIAVSEEKLRASHHKIILPSFSGFACDGNTDNNLREFAFFDAICAQLNVAVSAQNYATLPRIAAGRLTIEQSRILDHLVADLCGYYQTSEAISASLVHQLAQYSRAFFSFVLSFSAKGAVEPGVFVTANDHSPVRVALSMVMKGLGVPRVYLQHAEVTEIFPALDFDCSVLRNRRSLDTYRKVGPLPANVYIIPRQEGAFNGHRLVTPRNAPVTVAIYPTSRISIGPLREVIGNLVSNPDVGTIVIKEHPGAAGGLNELAIAGKVHVTKSTPDGEHIAIVGNSSVAVELLHNGVPVYQIFDFDPVKPDYYGLVATGVTKEITIDSCREAFWTPYETSGRWLEAFSAWDPSATVDHLKDRASFIKEINALKLRCAPAKGGHAPRMRGRWRARAKGSLRRNLVKLINSHPKASSLLVSSMLVNLRRLGDEITIQTDRVGRFLLANTNISIKGSFARHANNGPTMGGSAVVNAAVQRFLFETLVTVENPVQWLDENERLQVLPPSELIAALDRAFHERNPRLTVLFKGIVGTPASIVGWWALLKKVELSHLPLDGALLDTLADFVYRCNQSPAAKAMIERALLQALLRAGSLEQLDRFWSEAQTVRRSDLTINTQLQLLRKLRAGRGRDQEVSQLLLEIGLKATSFEILKMQNAEFLEGRAEAEWTHLRAEEKFLKEAPYDLRQDFRQKVKPIYNELRTRMQFMNIRTDEQELERLKTLIGACVRERRPFSMIRLSDGEGYLFPQSLYFSLEDRLNRERHWWGTELSSDLRNKIVTEARLAVSQADVLGIPAVFRFIRDLGEGSLSLTHSLQGRGLVEVLSGVAALASPSALFTEDKANVALFSDLDRLDWLLSAASRVVVVSSVRRSDLPRRILDIDNLTVIEIPTHQNTALNTNYNVGEHPLPLVYATVTETLDRIIQPGDLVFVAGGIVGKILLGFCRSKGAVAIDLGHVMDDWISPYLTNLR